MNKEILLSLYDDDPRKKYKCKNLKQDGDFFEIEYQSPNNINFGSITLFVELIEKKIKFRFNALRGGFYSLMGRQISGLIPIINSPHLQGFDISIDGSNTWNLFKQDVSFDLYKLLFKQNNNIKLAFPYCGPALCDNRKQFCKLDLYSLNSLLNKYFSLSDTQEEYYNKLVNEYSINFDNAIGIMYRGTDKYLEMKQVDPKNFVKQAKILLEKNPNLNIFLQTDQTQVKDLFKIEFGNKCFFLQNIPSTDGTKSVHKLINDLEKRHSYVQSLEVACRFLSQCKYLITSSGNMGWTISGYRGNTTNLWQFNHNGKLVVPNNTIQ